MKKLTLDLDNLAVESFEPGEKGAENGTVRAFVATDCSCVRTCGAASNGEETYELTPRTLYACCV